ncbi:uncharacterized protein [Dermacentor albipictus]|uniref:uncharacterized protein isoform X4 n=1 Tax=Dermacentor albipictus TaxID=60249 RepID=UPI0038FD2B7E
MIYPVVILAVLLALPCSQTDQLRPPEPCVDEACVEYCMIGLGGPEFNVTGKCVKNETGAQFCSCRRRTYTTGSKRRRLLRHSVQARSMRKKRQAEPVKKKRPRCSETECSKYCGRKYYHQRPVSGICEGFDCICSWFIGYSMHKHPLPPYA